MQNFSSETLVIVGGSCLTDDMLRGLFSSLMPREDEDEEEEQLGSIDTKH